MQTAFRYTLLMGILIIPLYFSNVTNKFPLMMGAFLGGTLAFWIAWFIIRKKQKKENAEPVEHQQN